MKPSLKLVSVLFIFSLVYAPIKAQRVLAMSVSTASPPEDTTQFGVPIIDSTTLFSTIMNVVLADTNSIYKIHVKLGSSLHGTQYLSTSFDYGVDGIFGSTSYSQTDSEIILGLGTHAGIINYYAEVQIEKSDHTFEDVVLFSNN